MSFTPPRRPGPQSPERLQRDLLRAEQRFRALLDASRDGLTILRRGLVVHANPVVLELLGIQQPSELLGRPLLDHVEQADRGHAAERLDAALRGQPSPRLPPIAVRLLRGDFAHTWVEWSAQALDDDGHPTVLVSLREAGVNQRLQRALAESERLASLGALAAGVAHEVTNPLSYALVNLQWLEEELTGEDPTTASRRARVEEALDGVRRVGRIVDDLRTYAQAESAPAERVLLARAIEAALGLALQRIRHHVRVEWERGSPNLAALAPEGALVRVLVELLVHATRAFDKEDPERNLVLLRTGETTGQPWVEVECRAHLRATCPEPGGLLVRATRLLGAELSSRTRPEGEHLVRLVLPAAPVPGSTAADSLGPGAGTARIRVLVVDDEPLICRALSLGLSRDCDITTFTSGQAALDHLQEGPSYDVVLLDVMMEPPAGPELWTWLAENQPTRRDRVLFITGGATTQTAAALLRGTQARVLTKPIDLGSLRRLVRQVGRQSRAQALV